MEIRREDIVTVPNAVTTAGLVLVADGSRELDTWAGFAKAVAGRFLDLADGKLARTLDQCSDVGAGYDATVDKLGGAMILAAQWRKDIAPKPALAAIAAQNIANGVLTTIAAKADSDGSFTPTKWGKYAMATQNLALGAYEASYLTKESEPEYSQRLRWAGHIATVTGVGILGGRATYQYYQRARQALAK